MFSLYCQYRTYDSQQSQYVNKNICFYDDSIPEKDYIVFSPELEKEVGTSGSLSFVLPPTNIGYDDISRDACELVCYKNGDEIWRGRILNDDSDFYNQRSIKCEGQLSYLNDAIIPRGNYGSPDNPLPYDQLLSNIVLGIYNAKNGNNDINSNDYSGPYDKRIFLSSFPTQTPAGKYIEIDNDKPLDIVNTICEMCNLYPYVSRDNIGTDANPIWRNRIHFVNGEKQNDGTYFPDTIQDQEIIFGKNLLDFTRNYDVTTLVTAVTMKGSNIEGSQDDEYYTLAELDKSGSTYSDRTDQTTGIYHPSQMTYMYYPAAVASYGWREEVLELETTGTEEEVTASDRPSEQLWSFGLQYLKVSQFDSMVIEINAVDLTYIGTATESLDIFKNIKVISEPHGLDRYFPITAMTIPLDNPANTSYKMGIEDDISLSASYNKTNQALFDKIRALPSTKSIVDIAKDEAAAMIAGATSGYITITQDQGKSEALVISTFPDYTDTDPSNEVWVFNSGGLAHWTGGWRGQVPTIVNTAITADGKIVADFITAGTLNALLIKGEKIILASQSQQTSPYVELNRNAFIGHKANGQVTFHITPFLSTGSYDPVLDTNQAVSYAGYINVFESKETWVGSVDRDSQGNLVGAGYLYQTLGARVPRAGTPDAECVVEDNTAMAYNFHNSSLGPAYLWRIRIGGRYITFMNGMLVQDEAVQADPVTHYGDYYSGNITIGNDTWKVNDGLIVGQVQPNNNE